MKCKDSSERRWNHPVRARCLRRQRLHLRATDFFRRQTKLLVLIMVFIIFYIHNRYASQQQQIEIDRLKKELIDIKYDALTRSSELMEKSRQSRIEEYISNKESDLQTSTNPPYLIK